MNHYIHNKISDRSYVITEDYGERSRYTIGLFVGEHSAALVDSGWGVTGNLRDYIRDNISSKPLICLLTHPHPDHMGASVQFDKVYMNRVDEAISLTSRTKEKRLGDLKNKFEGTPLFAEMEAEVTDCSGFEYEPLLDGQHFDLGGIELQALSVPGHTPGSMVFYCPEEKLAFVGDTIGNRVMFLGEEASIPDYITKLREFMARVLPDTRLYGGHSQESMDLALLGDILAACENVACGRAQPVPADIPPFIRAGLGGKTPLAEQVGDAVVIYI